MHIANVIQVQMELTEVIAVENERLVIQGDDVSLDPFIGIQLYP